MQKGSALKMVVLVVAVVVIVLALWMSKSKMSGVNPPVSGSPSASPKASSEPKTATELFKVEPSANATQEQQIAHYNLVAKAAVVASSVNVSGCTPNPSVVKVTMGNYVTFKNGDSKAHKIYNGALGTTEVPAYGEAKVKTTNQGAFGYTCDDKLVGIVFVAQ